MTLTEIIERKSELSDAILMACFQYQPDGLTPVIAPMIDEMKELQTKLDTLEPVDAFNYFIIDPDGEKLAVFKRVLIFPTKERAMDYLKLTDWLDVREWTIEPTTLPANQPSL